QRMVVSQHPQPHHNARFPSGLRPRHLNAFEFDRGDLMEHGFERFRRAGPQFIAYARCFHRVISFSVLQNDEPMTCVTNRSTYMTYEREPCRTAVLSVIYRLFQCRLSNSVVTSLSVLTSLSRERPRGAGCDGRRRVAGSAAADARPGLHLQSRPAIPRATPRA